MSETVRIERRGALTGPMVCEMPVVSLSPDARAALAGVLAEPVAAGPVRAGADRVWYRITMTGPEGVRVRDVAELPAMLRGLPKFGG